MWCSLGSKMRASDIKIKGTLLFDVVRMSDLQQTIAYGWCGIDISEISVGISRFKYGSELRVLVDAPSILIDQNARANKY
jgi:hypothetical protein